MKKSLVILTLMVYTLTAFSAEKPNIVLLFVDDLGWADLGYRSPQFSTPNVDKLSKQGMDFERAYVATPTCSPSRTSILTGKEPVRIQMVRHIDHEDPKTGRNSKKFSLWKTDPVQMPSINWLPLEEITYAERLKEYGYYNMFIGKWHSGHEEFHPIHQGFDAQWGTGNHGHPNSYYAPFFRYANPLAQFQGDEYLTDVLTDKAEDFIKTYDKNQPFMLSMWYYNVHGPHKGKKELIEKYKKAGLGDRYANYAAMIESMDQSVGRIRAALKDKGIDKNTVVIFTSDQGGYFTNGPLRGAKTGGNTLGEGGARVPFIVYYPGLTKRKSKCATPIQTLDVYPTLVEIASGKPCTDTQINGVSLMPLLKKQKIAERDLFFFRSYEDQYAAIINGDWKLIKYHSGILELYNIKKDIGEVSNLYRELPEKAKEMADKLAKWEQEAVPAY